MGSWSASSSFFSADSLIVRLLFGAAAAAAPVEGCAAVAAAGTARTATEGITKALAQEAQEATAPAAPNKKATEVFMVLALLCREKCKMSLAKHVSWAGLRSSRPLFFATA